MNIGLENFRQARGGFLEREIEITLDKSGQGSGSEPAVRQSGQSRLAARLGGWISSKLSGPQLQERVEQRNEARVEVKRQFLDLLTRTEGSEAAQRALEACRLPDGWKSNDRPLTNHQVGRILDAAQEYRRDMVRHNDRMLSDALAERPRISRDLRAAISRAVKTDAQYGRQQFGEGAIEILCEQAAKDLSAVRRQQCQERFPALSQYVLDTPEDSLLRQRVALDPAILVDRLKDAYGWRPDFVSSALNAAFTEIGVADELLGRQAWSTKDLRALSGKLEQQVGDLERVITDLKSASEPSASGQELQELYPSESKKLFYDALCADLERQIQLLEAKRTYVDEMRLIDPLTDRAVEHSKLVWTHAGLALLDRLEQMVQQGQVAQKDQILLTGDQKTALQGVKKRWMDASIDRAHEYNRGHEKLDALESIPAPSKGNRGTHPIVQGQRDLMERLRQELEQMGIPKKTLKTLFSKASRKQAQQAALSGIETWQPVSRNMPVMRNGAMRIYRSEIMPAHLFDRRLGVDQGGRLGGVPSPVRDSAEHARNLKVSRLMDPSGQVMTTVVGHGVLDSWGIPDAVERQQANQRGALEVLELALAGNDRLMGRLTGPRHADTSPPRLVHVSVNLVSPDSVRDLLPGLKDQKEKTYTFNQFAAFEANVGRDRTLRLLDGHHHDADRTATVHVEAITFSFGTDEIATGIERRVLFGAWHNVHAHNTRNMIKLIGDLGEGGFGARGGRPGGFVDEVYDRLHGLRDNPQSTAANREKAMTLLAQLQGQTDLVRTLFTEKAFREGKGDTSKMGREILVLQGLAEQGLALVGATDLAGTMSKGCKSDKDRGGVTDVELKAKLILRDLGGDMRPDERLQDDEQGVYAVVGAGSGQLDVQRWNTGLPGSKQARLLSARVSSAEFRQFVAGLSLFAKS